MSNTCKTCRWFVPERSDRMVFAEHDLYGRCARITSAPVVMADARLYPVGTNTSLAVLPTFGCSMHEEKQ